MFTKLKSNKEIREGCRLYLNPDNGDYGYIIVKDRKIIRGNVNYIVGYYYCGEQVGSLNFTGTFSDEYTMHEGSIMKYYGHWTRSCHHPATNIFKEIPAKKPRKKAAVKPKKAKKKSKLA